METFLAQTLRNRKGEDVEEPDSAEAYLHRPIPSETRVWLGGYIISPVFLSPILLAVVHFWLVSPHYTNSSPSRFLAGLRTTLKVKFTLSSKNSQSGILIIPKLAAVKLANAEVQRYSENCFRGASFSSNIWWSRIISYFFNLNFSQVKLKPSDSELWIMFTPPTWISTVELLFGSKTSRNLLESIYSDNH